MIVFAFDRTRALTNVAVNTKRKAYVLLLCFNIVAHLNPFIQFSINARIFVVAPPLIEALVPVVTGNKVR